VTTTPAGHEDIAAEQAVLLQILDQISRRQENAICLFQGGIPMIGDRERSMILNFYEKTKNTEPDKLNKIGVLALLSGQQLEAVPTIEDYLFGRLWLAVQDREDPVPIIKDVGENIRKWGPSHFMTEGSGAWGYCLPLLAAQQYKTALSFLAQAGGTEGLLEAVHLGLIFSMAGVEVSDLGEGIPSGPASGDLVTVWLSKYAQILESDPSPGLTASLQYLLRIPSQKDSQDQIAALIARHPDRVDFFAGTLDSLLSRQQSELDKFLPPNEVASILDTTADIFKEQSADFNKAQLSAKLLMLAHRYSKLTELLIQMITPTDAFDNEKIYWNEQSQSFYDAHLSRRSVVVEHLESCHKMNLAYTLKTLLELRRFFDFRRQGKFEEAFSVVAATELLPLRQDQLDANQGKFKDYHPALKAAFPTILSAAIECLYERYRRLKSESRGITVEVEAHLRELAMCARILFLFSGLINMPGTCRNSITQMRANMI
jgi:Nup93/Nic96